MLRRLSLAIAVAAASVALVQAAEAPLSSKTDLVTVYQLSLIHIPSPRDRG